MKRCMRLALLFVSTVSADLGYTDSYGSPAAPSANNYDSYSAPAAPTYQQAYQQPVQHQHQHYQEPAYQPRNGLNHDHVHHHYYHPSNPIVKVPVTRAPFVVRVPQNVPVKFVPVNVPTQAPQYQHLPVQYAPNYGYHLQEPDCDDVDLDCFKGIANDWFGDGKRPQRSPFTVAPSPYPASYPAPYPAPSPYPSSYPPPPYANSPYPYPSQQDTAFVERKELIKSALLLGAGVVKGAVITTLINQAQNNGK